MNTVIEMAREAGIPVGITGGNPSAVQIEHFAELVRADEAKRADALAATIMALRDIVTSDAESKTEFIARVCEVLGSCPDQRVLNAVAKEREACAKVCEATPKIRAYGNNRALQDECAAAIRARGQA